MNFNPAREGKESVVSPIALIGMGCRLPGGANTPASFWRQLLSGQSAISEIPPTRFSIAAHVDANPEAPGKSYSRWGGFIDDVAGFDPAIFEISPREAQAMDPQQRLLLMVAYEAMEDAGLTRARLGDARTGVYVGVSTTDYASIQRQQSTHADIYSGTGSALSIVANRLSHRFDLKGPSLSVDTACSSSLVALDQAVTALNSGKIDIAIVAGAHLLLDPGPFVAFSKAGMLSPTGRLSAFDRRANGYVRGEGIGAVLLMRQADALFDGLGIRALVRTTASNQDGRTPTLTAPDPLAQRAMMTQLVATAEIAPHDVDYVEAHGTGTPIGDPIEASAIGHVFGGALRSAPLLLGSVKPNIGHLEAAAGIASLIKAVLSLENRMVPASINFEDPNPAIAFEAHNMAVPRVATALGRGSGGPLRIAVNSFGFGGTNAGVLLESAPSSTIPPAGSGDDSTLHKPRSIAIPISAASSEALRDVASKVYDAVADGGLAARSVSDIATSLGTMREGLGKRATIIAASQAELLDGLRQVADAEAASPVRGLLPSAIFGTPRPDNRLAFTFAGQGGQWAGMAQRLLLEEPAFASAFHEFDRVFERLSGWSVRSELMRHEASSRLSQSRYAMPAIFGVQLGLGALWRSFGVRPDFVIGHSFGELAAAHLAGAIDLNTATHMIHVRCQIREKIGRDGAMLAVGMAPHDLSALLGEDSEIDLAAINADAMVTLAGPVEAIADLSRRLSRERPSVLVRPVQSDTAWHSRQLAPLEQWFRQEVGEVQWQAPNVAFISTVTGRIQGRLDADYWWHNLRQAVRYRDAVVMALDLGANAFLELSPHRVLSGLNATNAAARVVPVTIANSMVRNEDDFRALAVAVGQLQGAGIVLDWQSVGGGRARAADLPTYPWQLSQHCRLSEEANDQLHVAPAFPLLGRRGRGPDPIWNNEISLRGFPYLRDHVVGGDVIFPAAGYFELMLSAGRELFGEVVLELEDFEIASPLFIGADEDVFVSTRFDLARHQIQVRTRTRDGAAEWIVRATALLRPTDVAPDLSLPEIDEQAIQLDAGDFYALTTKAGFSYGPAFSGVTQAAIAGSSGTGEVVAPSQVSLAGSAAHPCILDAALQLACPILGGHRANPSDDGAATPIYVPKRLRRLRLAGTLPRHIQVQAFVDTPAAGGPSVSYRLADADGQCLLALDGLELTPMGRQASMSKPENVEPAYYAETFVPFQPTPSTSAKGTWLILGATSDLADVLRQEAVSVTALTLSSEAPDLLSHTRAQVASAIGNADTVVFHAWAGDATEDNLVATSQRLAMQLIATAQAIQAAPSALRELVVMTHGARQLPNDPPMSLAGLAASSLVGLVRTIALENPDLRVRQIDCTAANLAELASGMADGSAETELVCRYGTWFAPRLVTDTKSDLPRGLVEIAPASASETFHLTMKAPGSSNNLYLEASPIPPVAPGEVLVETAAVGLNFRDVMAVTGLLPAGAEPDPAWLNLGLEFSGTVRVVGSGVMDFAPGDRVMGMARACLRGVVVTPAASLTRLPPDLTFEQAATIPSAFSTAHYALARVGRLERGERVLIHLGTGGVGLAAIQVARSLGAEIFATAGSDEKRAYLRGIGVRHVFNSRSLGFADDIMRATGDRGVDVVLNALPAHFIVKSLQVLAPFGRFLEIGKRDVYEDTPLGMHALRRNISFSAIDLAAMAVQRPDLLANVLAEVTCRFEEGVYHPLPVTQFAIESAAEAFNLMARGRHIGKVVIRTDSGRVKARASANRELTIHADRSYLVTGGTNGFGLEIARWLSRRGAGHVILASRSGQLGPQDQQNFEANGTIVEPLALDLADAAAVEAFVAERTMSQRPLAGVIHGAAVFRDGLLGQLDQPGIEAVLRPKIAGAWALHRALAKSGHELDFFLHLSSLAQVLGSLGQANYVAANSFLEGFAAYRSSNGLTAQVVNLGALAEAGFVADNAAMASYLDSIGILPMPSAATLALLEGFAASSATSRSIAAIDWGRVQSASGRAGMTPRLQGLIPGSRGGDHKLRQLLGAMPPANWAAVLQDFLVGEVGRVLDVEPQSVPVNRPLAELGLDSLSSIELKNRIESKLALSLTVGAFLQAPTLEKLASVIAATIEEQLRSERGAGDGPEAMRNAGKSALGSSLQLWAMKLALAPMTSPAGRAALEQTADGRVGVMLSPAELDDRLSRLCDTVEDIALTWSGENPGLVRGERPQVTFVQNPAEASARPLVLEAGELARIVATEQEGQVTHIGLRLHLAIGVQAGSLLEALIADDPGLVRHLGAEMPNDEDRIAREAASRALLTPWAGAPPLPGASLATVGCLDGLNIGPSIYLPVLETREPLSEAQCLFAFGQAIGTLCDSRDLMVERFAGPLVMSTPIRITLGPDTAGALALIQHQLELSSHCLDSFAMELLLAGELDGARSRLRQFAFSVRTDRDPAPPAWNALALHVITSEGSTRMVLAFDPQAISEAAAERVAGLLNEHITQVAIPISPSSDVPALLLAKGHVAARSSLLPTSIGPEQPGYPVSPGLANLLDAVSDPRATATLRRASILCQAIRVRPGIDIQRLQRAAGKLMERHDFLRSRFTRIGGQWRVLAHASAAPLHIQDLAGSSDAAFDERVRALAGHPYDLGQSQLVEIHLLRRGEWGDVVMVRLFEGIADGWSLGIVLDELLKAYIGLDLGRRPPGLPQILQLAAPAIAHGNAVFSQGVAGVDRLKLGPNRVRTIRLRGTDVLRNRARTLGTTENGLLCAAFAQALVQAGHGPLSAIGTYDPARADPRLHHAVAFLSRLVLLDLPETSDVLSLAHRLDTQFINLADKHDVLGGVPEFIYAPLLPRQILKQSLFGSAMRQITKGGISMMSLDIELLDLAPIGLQEGRLQLRPLPLEGWFDLRLHYDMATFSEADMASLGRAIVANTGLPVSTVESENLSEILAAPEDLSFLGEAQKTT